MIVVDKKITEIKPYENNPRINEAAVEKVAESIRQFGFQQPIVIDKDNVIIVGHTRYKAAIELGYDKVPCVVADNLSEEKVKAYRIADNKVAEFSMWDEKLLTLELIELEQSDEIYMGDFGLDPIDIEPVQSDPAAIEAGDYPSEEDGEPSRGYSIVYEICFNDEAEQEEWYDFLRYLKKKYTDLDTISERILAAVRCIVNDEA